ncbi:hypothetical protein FRC02_012154 [Tulasnella sp. 418]|nr:hypothetical protein FRC02_012154 [Tulasnella sp. 418]
MAQVSEALFPRPLILHSTGVLRKSIYARGTSRFSHINGEGIDENLTAKYTIMAHDGRASVQSTLDKLLLYRETLLDTSKRLAYDLLGPRTFDWSADMMTQDRINAASQEFVATYPVIGLGLAKDVFADVSSDANVLKSFHPLQYCFIPRFPSLWPL